MGTPTPPNYAATPCLSFRTSTHNALQVLPGTHEVVRITMITIVELVYWKPACRSMLSPNVGANPGAPAQKIGIRYCERKRPSERTRNIPVSRRALRAEGPCESEG